MREQKNMRQSNFELLRIIAMLIIIAHHYVVLSGITEFFDYDTLPSNMLFLQFLGWGGKMAINIFVLISAYFICLKNLIWAKVLKLILEILFYNLSVTVVLMLFGIFPCKISSVLKMVFEPITSIGYEFVGSFIVFYLFVPFLNILIRQLTKKQHFNLMIFSVIVFSVFYTLSAFQASRYVLWFFVLYFIGSYIRKYPNVYTDDKKYGLWASIFFLALSWLSIYAIDRFGYRMGFHNYYYFCCDSQKILALCLSISVFVWFKNINFRDNKMINSLAASAFGVLLIHSNSREMRHFLWNDILNVPGMYSSTLLPIHFILSIFGIYMVCALIDHLRIRFLEKPIFSYLERYQCLKKEVFV